MYLFTRNSRVLSGGGGVMADLVAVTDFVNRNTDLDTSLYSMAVGTEPGSISWSGIVKRRSELVDAIWADERYMAKLGEAKDMFQPGVGGSAVWRKVH